MPGHLGAGRGDPSKELAVTSFFGSSGPNDNRRSGRKVATLVAPKAADPESSNLKLTRQPRSGRGPSQQRRPPASPLDLLPRTRTAPARTEQVWPIRGLPPRPAGR